MTARERKSEEPDPLTRTGANSMRAGMDLLEGMVQSGRLAVGELEEGLKRADVGEGPELRVVAESVARGYLTFFREMTRTARDVADVYRSESGTLVRKPRPRAATRAATGAAPSSHEENVAEGTESLPGGNGRSDELGAGFAEEFSHVVDTVFDILRRGGTRGG